MSRSFVRHWERACGYLRQQQVRAARAELEAMRVLAPGDPRCGLLSARLAWREDHPREAAAHALEAGEQAPDDPETLCDVIETLVEVGESARAHELFARPVWERAPAGETLLRYVDLAHRFGDHAAALAALDRMVAVRPGDAALHCHRGLQFEYLGRLAEAAVEYEACLAAAPGYGHAAYQLARLHRAGEVGRLLEAIRRGLGSARPGSREHADFEFARYHLLEDLGETDAAWQALATANAIMHVQVSAAADRQLGGLRQFQAWLTTHTIRAAAVPQTGPSPIFILGMPRSGTTVLERMLGNHSQVFAAGELQDFGQQLLYASHTRSAYSEAFYQRLPTLDFGELGRRYLAQTRWRADGKDHCIDKQPGNWMLAGLIHAALPHARILHLVRDPMDVCFSNWRARFVTYAWSYAFPTLADYHSIHRGMMQQWHALFPGAIMDVPYADLVREPAATLRRVLEFCGLAWEPGCEDLARNAAPVSTLSAAAVREPLHSRALGQWRCYAAQLEPLRQALSAA